MPSVRPRSSRPVNWARFHSPRRTDASAGGDPAGDAVEQREGVLGGRDRVAGRGVDDGDAGPRRGVEVDVVDADAGPADDDEPRAGGDELGVDLDLAADDRARRSRAGSPHSSSRVQPRRSSTSWCGARGARRPRAATDSATRTLTRRPRRGRAAGDARTTRAPRRWAAATAAPGLDRPAAAERRRSRACSIAPRISSSVTEPRWPRRKILPVSLPWPPARTTPRRLTSPLNAFQSRSSGTCAAVTVREAYARVGEQLEAERREAGPGRGGARLVAGEDRRRRPPRLHQPQALVDLVDDRDGRGERRLAVGRGVAVRPQVEVEARHRRRLHRRPARAARRRSWPGPGAAIQAFCEPVTTTSTPHASISNGTAPRPDTLSTRMSASGASSRMAAASSGDRVHDPGRGLVVGQQDGLRRRASRGGARGPRRRPRRSPTRRRAWSRPRRRSRRSWRTGRRTSRC